MNIEQQMYTKAVEFIKQRYPIGWGGAAVMHTADDQYLISVALESANASVVVCIETGAMCEAQKYNLQITHSLCVVRDDENAAFKVLSPCGVCQERLRYWGEDVRAGVTTMDGTLKFVSLKELQPYHWTRAYSAETLERYQG
ncbi:MAG: cytidine deaminase [Bacillaceae bacterium]